MDIDLSKPAWGPGSQKVEDLTEAPVASQAEDVKVSGPVAPSDSVEEESGEQKVPYSRFKKFHDRALEAEREAAEWRARAESIVSRTSEPETGEVPSYWTELYGDSDAAKRAWRIQERANEEIEIRAEQRAIEAVQSERHQESERISQNEDTIDENLEELSALVGRNLTDREQSDILDIVDEYTPKGRDGNYLGPTIPFDKAWEIYELKNSAVRGPRSEARDKVASLSGSQSRGDSSEDKTEQDKNWNPLDWNAWKKRL